LYRHANPDSGTYSATIEEYVGRVGIGSKHVDLINAFFGFQFALEKLQAAADRIICLERCFNLREGLSRADDTLQGRFPWPFRWFYTPKQELDGMLDKNYALKKWDKDGVSTDETLKHIVIDDIVQLEDLRW